MPKQKEAPAMPVRRDPFIKILHPAAAPLEPPRAEPAQLPLPGIEGLPFLDPRRRRRRNVGRSYR